MLGNCIHALKSGKPPAALTFDDYQQANIDELKVDIANFVGEKVKVRGVGVYMTDAFFLKREPSDPSFIMIDSKRLAREQKIDIVKECSKNIILGCPITIYGTTGAIGVDFGILAEKIELHK